MRHGVWQKRALTFATLVASTIAARRAAAQDPNAILQASHHNYESPQNFLIELRLGPYRPNIDSDPSLHGAQPYNTVFGSPEHVYVGGEFDWQAFRIPHIGTIGPGLGFGEVGISRQAKLVGRPGYAAENTSLSIYPFYLVGVFRFDMPMRELRIPFVPYVKVGFGYALWNSGDDSGTTVVNGVSAEGHTLGTHFAVGLSFNLNVFDEYTARNFDEQMGVNHSYLYGELYSLDLTGIGQTDALRVGNTSWVLGLAFEF